MGRVIGLIACSSLVAATLWFTNLTFTTKTVSAGADRPAARTTLAPKDAFKRGKEMFLRGRYAEAVPLLTAAQQKADSFSAAERRQLADYLARAEAELERPAATIRGQSPRKGSAVAQQSAEDRGQAAARQRVERLLTQAEAAWDKQDYATAERLANTAARLAKEAKLSFAPGQKSPASVLEQFAGTDANQSAAWSSETADAGSAADEHAIQTASNTDASEIFGDDMSSETVDAGPSADEVAANPPTTLSTKEQATWLVTQARADLKAGRYEEARRKALQAVELDETYDLFEDRPELVINDLDRKTGTTTALARRSVTRPSAMAKATKPTKAGGASAGQPVATVASQTRSPATTKPAADNPEVAATESAGPATELTGDAAKAEAQQLLTAARQALNAGDLDVARAKALAAMELNVSYKLFEERPELVLNDIESAQSAASLAANSADATAEMPAEGTPAPASTETRAQVQQLLTAAREALTNGQTTEARQKAIEAQQLADEAEIAFGLFDDRPDIVLADVARLATRGVPAGNPARGGSEVAAVDGDSESPAPSANQQARQTLAAARLLIQQGQYDEARAKVLEAEQLQATYDVLEDTPELVLDDLNRLNAARLQASRNGGSSAMPASPSSAAPAARNATESFEASEAEFPVIAAGGMSGQELYNRGMFELNQGHRDAAYQYFLAAHQSGQKFDRLRTQRLQDYLRELSPKNNRVAVANHQISDSDGNTGTNEPSQLDLTQQQLAVKFDRMRTEVLNAIFRAERLREKDPEQALQVIDRAAVALEGTDLSPDAVASLSGSLARTRTSLEAEIARREPNLAQDKKNDEVKQRVIRDTENQIRIESEFARLTEEFNDLMKQRRFAEAEVAAKKAKELDPKNPSAETMFWKSRLARRVDNNDRLKNDKEESFWSQLNDVELAAVANVGDDPIKYSPEWKDLSKKRLDRFRPDARAPNEEEDRIEQSLKKRVSLHEDGAPLGQVLDKIAALAGINIVRDDRGLEDEQVSSTTPVTINVEGIMVKSVLNLILDDLNLGYMIKDEALKITSRIRQQGDLDTITYPVADLVTPIPNVVSAGNGFNPMNSLANLPANAFNAPQMSVPNGGSNFGQAFAQVGAGGAMGGNGGGLETGRRGSAESGYDFDSLTELLTSTIAPSSWEEAGGAGAIRRNETTLSLVIRQTQRVHEEIRDLLEQLRRLQDLQVTIEVRFITVADRFFERIGIDFDFNVQDNVGGPNTDNSGRLLQPFGSVQLPNFGTAGTAGVAGVAGGAGGGGAAGVAGVAGAAGATGFFTPGPTRQLTNRDSYKPQGTVVGMNSPTSFNPDLDVPFRQGSFEVGVPTFGGFNPNAGLQVGMAILSDIEAFFFISAAQGDNRTNLLFAPKVTLFNGQVGTVSDTVNRPFVISLIPTVGFFSVGFQPQIAVIPSGINMTVTAVVSADRRYVRLNVLPLFTSITDVFTFSFVGGAGGAAAGGAGGAAGAAGGAGGLGGAGGVGGGAGAGGFGAVGFGGIGGIGGAAGGAAGAGARGAAGTAGQTITVQQPVIQVLTVITSVSVPDGGTVLLGGVKRLREGRSMSGVPILNKIPYVSRLFKNTGVGRETESAMLMVTPRIIIQEEEEELLGIPLKS